MPHGIHPLELIRFIMIKDNYHTTKNSSLIKMRFVIRNNEKNDTQIYLNEAQIYSGIEDEVILDLGIDAEIFNKSLKIVSNISNSNLYNEIQIDLYLTGGTTARQWRWHSRNIISELDAQILLQ
jgi:hypothetical protein